MSHSSVIASVTHQSDKSSTVGGVAVRNKHTNTSTANWHLRCCSGQLSSRIPPDVRKASTECNPPFCQQGASHQAFIGQILSL